MGTPATIEQLGGLLKKFVKLTEMVQAGVRPADPVGSMLQRAIDGFLDPPKATLKDADRLAEILCRSDIVLELWLFGSLVREGTGSDIDMVVVTDLKFHEIEEAYRTFDTGYSLRQTTKEQRKRFILERMKSLSADEQGILNRAPLDLWILPLNWESRTSELQRLLLPKSDQTFLQTVHRQGLLFNEQRGEFPRQDRRLEEVGEALERIRGYADGYIRSHDIDREVARIRELLSI